MPAAENSLLIIVTSICLSLLAATAALALGRLTVRAFRMASARARIVSLVGLAVSAILISVAPLFAVAFLYFEDLGLERLMAYRYPRSMPYVLVAYCALIGMAYRLGMKTQAAS